MKSSSFRTDPPAEGDIQETRTQRRQVNWEKVAYLALLALLLILVGRYVLANYFYIEGDGQVVTGTFDVRFSSDVRVQEFFKEEEEHVERGAPLFRYAVVDETEETGTFSEAAPTPSGGDMPSEERLDLNEDLSLKRIELRKKRKLLARQRDRLERIRRGTYLDVYTAEELEAAENEATELEADVQALRQEIQTLRTKKQRLQNRSEAQQQRRRLSSSNDSLGRSRTYRAPVSGTVTDLFARPSEVVLVSERVMTISMDEPGKLYVKAVFEQEALDHLSEGDRVTVAYANGEETSGRVRHLLATTSDRADKSRSEYVQMNRRIVAEIYPDTPEARATWIRLQRMGLTVHRPKFWSPTMDLWPF
jgi:multidrug resistance efflux pump